MDRIPPITNVRPKDAFYRIQDPISGLYARIKGEAPSRPEPAEEANGTVVGRHSHVDFAPWELATWFRTRDEALAAFGRYIGVAALEIVRCDA